jgi:hypothetical protein
MFQADKPDGGIDFANLVISNDGLMPRDMTPGRELEPALPVDNSSSIGLKYTEILG